MRTPEGDKILDIIQRHVGCENAIGAVEIALELGWVPSASRTVRRIIADESHLWSGVLVCGCAGKGDSGYFVAASYEEAETYYNWLLSLAAVANRKVFNFREACSKMGIRFGGKNPDRINKMNKIHSGNSVHSVETIPA